VAFALKMRKKKKKCNFTKYARSPIYRKLYAILKEKVRSIAVLNVLDHGSCIRSHITTIKFHGAAMKAMAARATHVSRVYVDVLDPGPHTQSQVRSIVSLCARLQRQGLLASFSPFSAL
jgi:hypothetical protein